MTLAMTGVASAIPADPRKQNARKHRGSQGGYLKVRIKTKTQENKMGTIRHTFEEIALRGHFITAEL